MKSFFFTGMIFGIWWFRWIQIVYRVFSECIFPFLCHLILGGRSICRGWCFWGTGAFRICGKYLRMCSKSSSCTPPVSKRGSVSIKERYPWTMSIWPCSTPKTFNGHLSIPSSTKTALLLSLRQKSKTHSKADSTTRKIFKKIHYFPPNSIFENFKLFKNLHPTIIDHFLMPGIQLPVKTRSPIGRKTPLSGKSEYKSTIL